MQTTLQSILIIYSSPLFAYLSIVFSRSWPDLILNSLLLWAWKGLPVVLICILELDIYICVCTYMLISFIHLSIGLMKKLKVLVAQSCLTLCDPRDGSLPGSSVCGILQARILKWIAIPFSRGSSRPRDGTQVSCIVGRFFTVWVTRETFGLIWSSVYTNETAINFE